MIAYLENNNFKVIFFIFFGHGYERLKIKLAWRSSATYTIGQSD